VQVSIAAASCRIKRGVQTSKSKDEEGTNDRGRQQQQARASLAPHLNAQSSLAMELWHRLAAKRQTILDDELSEDLLLALPPQSRAGTVDVVRKWNPGELLGHAKVVQ
jgi:hypothetical protein